MAWIALIISIAVLLVVLYGIFETRRSFQEMMRARQNDRSMAMLQQQMESSAKLMSQQIASMSEQVGSRLDSAGKLVGDLKQGLGRLEEGTKRILDVGKEVSELQDIFRAPKLRGGFGEFLLGDLLGQILSPENFELQYRFKSGEKVDAVVKLQKAFVPIDAKFPLENFKRITSAASEEDAKKQRKQFTADVRKHVDAIAQKYILPDEGTFDFALMYIPAENLYYETIIRDEELGEDRSLNSYALDKRVIPVSPNSLYAYLQAIVMGLKGMRIEKEAKQVMENLARLSGDMNRFAEEFRKIGGHISNAGKSFESAERRLGRFADRLDTITSIEHGGGPEAQLTMGENDDA